MWGRSAFATAALLALCGSCSESKLRAGYCERDSDCATGEHCVLEGAATFTCASSDAGGGDAIAMCTGHSQCPADKPICDIGDCRACDASSPGDGAACASRDSTRPVCGPNGSCVECASATSADCTADPIRPICDLGSNSCVACSSVAQCAAKGVGPGICMAHQDGRCAADSEVIYVANTAGCASDALSAMAGSATTPFCGPQIAVATVTSIRRIIIVSGTVAGFQWAPSTGAAQISVFGRNSAVIAGGAQPSVVIAAGADLYMRGPLAIGPGPEMGVSASGSAVLRLEEVQVDGNQGGGILIDGARFDIRNAIVTGNGPGTIMGFPWGGIRIQNASNLSPAALSGVTLSSNDPVGLSCDAPVVGSGVLAMANTSVQIATTCGINPCSPAGPNCGAQ